MGSVSNEKIALWKVRLVNWQTALISLQTIAKGGRDTPRALVVLRHEVVATKDVSDADKEELHRVLDRLQSANLYGQIALVGQLKEILSTYPAFKVLSAAFESGKN
jgi:hypothetical protein